MRWSGLVSFILGLALIALAALASQLGLAEPSDTISPFQALVLALGLLCAFAGVMLLARPSSDPRPPFRYLVEAFPAPFDAWADALTAPRAALALMIPILLGAAFLRLYHLTFQSLWLDELMTWWRSSWPTVGTVLRSVESDVWTPGHSLFIYAWMKLAGATDFALRFPAALAGVMGVAALYTLGRRLGGHLTGVFAALLIAVLEVPIYYSQEARPYSALILFAALSTYFWLRLLRALDRRHSSDRSPHPSTSVDITSVAGEFYSPANYSPVDFAAYVLFALLAMYWNYYGIVLVALQAVGAGLRFLPRPRSWPPLVAVYAAIAVGYLPWLKPTLDDLGRGSYLPTRPAAYGDELMQFFRFLFNLQQPYVLAAIALVAAALIVEAVRARRGERPLWAIWLLLLGWLLLPFTLTYVESLRGTSLLLHRYLLISLPAAVLLPALALARLPIRRWAQAGLMALALVVLLNNLVRHWDYYTRPTKADFRGAAAVVADADPRLGGPSLIAGFTGYGGTAQLFDFYFAQVGSPRRVGLEAGFDGDAPAVEKAAADGGARFVWIVSAQNRPAPAFIRHMQDKFTLIEQHELNNAAVWLFERP